MCFHVFFSVRWNAYVLEVLIISLTKAFVLFCFPWSVCTKYGENNHKEKRLRIFLKRYIIEVRYTNNWMIQGRDSELVSLTYVWELPARKINIGSNVSFENLGRRKQSDLNSKHFLFFQPIAVRCAFSPYVDYIHSFVITRERTHYIH